LGAVGREAGGGDVFGDVIFWIVFVKRLTGDFDNTIVSLAVGFYEIVAADLDDAAVSG
jgi:hypothetical protein